jgi:hypothetical protein
MIYKLKTSFNREVFFAPLKSRSDLISIKKTNEVLATLKGLNFDDVHAEAEQIIYFFSHSSIRVKQSGFPGLSFIDFL